MVSDYPVGCCGFSIGKYARRASLRLQARGRIGAGSRMFWQKSPLTFFKNTG